MKIPSISGKTPSQVFREIINFQRASRIVSVRGGRLQESPNGTTIIIDKTPTSGPGTTTSAICPFGDIFTDTEDPPNTLIYGGLMTCGDKNFNIDDYTIDTATDGQWLVQMKLVGITFATDDDEEIFLPGITTASGTPEWNLKVKSGATDYDDNANPANPTETGTIYVPLGILTITDNVPDFRPTGCGNIAVNQCAGILNYERV